MPEKTTETNTTTVTEIIIPEDKLLTIEKILRSNLMWSIQKDRIMALTGLKQSLCCICGQVSSPLYEVRYSYPDCVKFEIYCTTHLQSVYEQQKNKTNAEIAESYGCQIVDEVPPTIREAWD